MAKTGKNITFIFGGVSYLCLRTLNISGSASTSTSECSTASGNTTTTNFVNGENYTVSTTLVLPEDAAGITILGALDVGTTGALVAYPHGNYVPAIEYTWTNATVSTIGLPSTLNDAVTYDVSFLCDGAPVIAAQA